MNNTLRVIGVPEHFNLPWLEAIEDEKFLREGLSVSWKDEPGGTGAMCKALREGDAECAVLLTEGIITDIIRGNPSRIISGYVVSPLIWGVHTGAANPLRYHRDCYDKQIAISRKGSGSHLMPQVDALIKETSIPSDNFQVVGGLTGALESLEAQETDVFYWEKYTTKPYVDSGQLRRIGEFITPWPCFVIAAREDVIRQRSVDLRTLLQVIQRECLAFMTDEHSIERVASRYEQKHEDVERWFHSTVWADHSMVNPRTVQNVIYALKSTGIIEKEKPIEELVWSS
ncbi:MAG: uracil-DNA glycosylase [Flavobacteriales bacterium]|nr:uracil-DNA glycosylase [Flavobacteriales bacterium]